MARAQRVIFMKLPKLPTWLWIFLVLYTAGGAALKFGWWKPKGESAGYFWSFIYLPVLMLLRWLPSPKSPGADLPVLVGPSGMTDPTTYRPQSLRDRYNIYVASTPFTEYAQPGASTTGKIMTYEQWVATQTDEGRNVSPSNYGGSGGGNVN